jgi:hypothetical protein
LLERALIRAKLCSSSRRLNSSSAGMASLRESRAGAARAALKLGTGLKELQPRFEPRAYRSQHRLARRPGTIIEPRRRGENAPYRDIGEPVSDPPQRAGSLHNRTMIDHARASFELGVICDRKHLGKKTHRFGVRRLNPGLRGRDPPGAKASVSRITFRRRGNSESPAYSGHRVKKTTVTTSVPSRIPQMRQSGP